MIQVKCCQFDKCECPTCANKIQDAIGSALEISGCIGLFFSFTEVLIKNN